MINNNTQDIGTVVNGHNTLVKGVHAYIHSTNARLADLDVLTAGHEAKLVAVGNEMDAQKTAIANTEAALRTENEALRHELTEVRSRLDTQKSESDTENQQLRTSLQNLTLTNQEMLEQLMQLTSRFNELDIRSNSFFASTRAPSEVGDDDN